MQTLPRAVTAQLFPDPAAYAGLRAHWRALITSDRRQSLAAAHHLLYLALCGKDWRVGFTPITNTRKLANGGYYAWALWGALSTIHSVQHEPALLAPFDGLVTPAQLAQLRTRLPLPSAYRVRSADFTAQSWPFAAYLDPATPAA